MATPAIPTARGSIGCGTLATAPSSGIVGVESGEASTIPVFLLKFGFTAARVTWTDATTSGSSGSLKIMTFNEGVITLLGASHRWTNISDLPLTASGPSGGNGDVAGVIAFGTVAADAGDGALTGTEVDWAATCAFTEVPAGAAITVGATATVQAGVLAGVNGLTTAKDVYFNASGSAATCDGSGTMDFTGYFNIWGIHGGDL